MRCRRVHVAVAVLAFAAAANAATVTEGAFNSGGTGAAARFLTSASRAAHHGRYSEAIEEDSQAIAASPYFGSAYLQRSTHEMDAGRYDAAAADLDRVIAMHPDDMGLAMDRAKLALRRADGVAAVAAVKHAVTLPLYSYWHNPYEAGTYEAGNGERFSVTGHMESYADEYSSIAEQLLHKDDASLADMQAMMKLEAIHPEYILANYCYLAAVAGLEESAEIACEQAIEENPHDIGQYDSLGYVHLRMKQWDKAIADYNTALDKLPDLTLSLYGRGIAKRAKGDMAGGNADIAAATRGEPDIANIMQRLHAPAI